MGYHLEKEGRCWERAPAQASLFDTPQSSPTVSDNSRACVPEEGFSSSCQGKVEMSPLWQSRNVVFCLGLSGLHVNLRVPVKRRRALLASNPIKE
jgi:hypothetical protein